jgi:hypothetical protein
LNRRVKLKKLNYKKREALRSPSSMPCSKGGKDFQETKNMTFKTK